MAVLYNLARMTTATVGTGTITLGAAVSGYLTFALAGVANADVVSYAIRDGANSETGTGTYTSAGTTLTRTVTKSTNSNTAISLSGTAEVFITARAEDIANLGQNNTFTGTVTANSFIPSSATVPTNGMYLPAANTVGFSSNSTLLYEYSASNNLGRGTQFTHLFLTAGNAIAIRGAGTSNSISAIDFSNSADTQCGGIVVDQGGHTTSYGTSSDGRGKPYRVELKSDFARSVICALKVWDHSDERNLIRGIGVVAQEAREVLPGMVTAGDDAKELNLESPGFQMWQVDYSKAVPYLIGAIQDLCKQVDELKLKLDARL